MVDIEIAGVNPKWKKHAKTELEQLFAKFESLKVIVTKDFDNIVMEYLRKRGVTQPYKSLRAGGEAVACKVMNYPLNNQLATCLVINGNSEIFSNWKGGWAKITRIFCLFHEREHILLDQSRYRMMGHKKFFSHPSSTMECMSEFAHDISSEYMAERKAIETLQGVSKGDISSYFSNRFTGMIEVLVSYLESFGTFLAEEIAVFRLNRTTVDDFWGSIYLRTRDTLNALALVVACTHAIPSTSMEFESVKRNSTFKQLFEDTWNQVEQILMLMYDDQSSYQENLRSIAVSFRNLFTRFGIELRDTCRGMAVYLEPEHVFG